MTLSISQTFTVGNQTFRSQAEAEAFIAQQQRLEAIGKQLKSLEPKRDMSGGLIASFAPVDWSPTAAATRLDADPRTVLLIAAIALQGRDAEDHNIPADLADALAELLATEQELG